MIVMFMTPLILILFSAVVHAVVNILTKSARDKYAIRLLIGVFSALAVAPVASPPLRGLALAVTASGRGLAPSGRALAGRSSGAEGPRQVRHRYVPLPGSPVCGVSLV